MIRLDEQVWRPFLVLHTTADGIATGWVFGHPDDRLTSAVRVDPQGQFRVAVLGFIYAQAIIPGLAVGHWVKGGW